MSFDFGERKDEDPMADFLARERAAAGALSGDAELFGAQATGAASNSLGALHGQSRASAAGDRDFETSAANFPALDGEPEDFTAHQAPVAAAAAAAPAPASALDDDLLGGSGGAVRGAPAVQIDSDRAQFEQTFPELDDPSIAPPPPQESFATSNGFMAAPVQSNMHAPPMQAATPSLGISSDPYGFNSTQDESEAVRRWHEEQEEDIARREAAAERRKGETISKAEQEIDEFYAQYNKKKERSIAANKEAEAKFQAQRQAELAEGTAWSRVTKLVDLQNSQSKTVARTGPGSSDLTRMKEILLSLRREGETAPGASGY